MGSEKVDWMETSFSAQLDQFDHFTTRLGAYTVTLGLANAEIAAARNDYLWARYAQMQVDQFDTELTIRVGYRDALLNGPASVVASSVPDLGTEFATPFVPPVPDGVLGRWRKLVDRIKAHPNYTPAIGADLGVMPSLSRSGNQAGPDRHTPQPGRGGLASAEGRS